MKAKFLPLLLLAILLQVSMFSFANEMTSARRIRLKNKTEVQHRSIPVTPDACIENSLLSIDLLSTVPTVTVIIKNAETDEVVYTSTDLNVDKVYIDLTLAWNINRNMTKWGDIPVGPAGINYGVIAPAEMASGNLYFDDEDHNNKNWAQVWLGPQNQYEPHGTYYGVQLDRNTRYHVCLNTDKTNFTKLVRSAI